MCWGECVHVCACVGRGECVWGDVCACVCVCGGGGEGGGKECSVCT